MVIKCNFCNRELNENEFPLKDYKLLMCNFCFKVEMEFKERREREKRERGNVCSICYIENCKEKEHPTEWTIRSEISNLNRSIYQIGCCNKQPEDKEELKNHITQINKGIDGLTKYLFDETSGQNREFICPICNTENCNEEHPRQKEELTKRISSELNTLRHSINRIGNATLEDRSITIFLLAIEDGINYLDICLNHRALREEIKHRRIGLD